VRLSFNQLLARAATRVEIIVTFLAVLELIKRRQIYARQEQLFGDIQLVQREDSPLAPDRGETDADWDYTTD
jgi:segregation and condensation protein A